MGVGSVAPERSHALRLSDYLQTVDYRTAHSRSEKEAIYRFRYEAYRREGAIPELVAPRFHDEYDDMDNCWIFGLYGDDRLISSIRLHVINKKHRRGPALDVFPDIVGPMVDRGMTLIDPTRFVTDTTASRDFADLAYLTLRLPCMASEFFEADACLATVREEHRAFYKRVFRSNQLCDARPYPKLLAPICLMSADVRGQREYMTARHPVFLSSLTERRMLFTRMPDYDSLLGEIGEGVPAQAQERRLSTVN